MTKQHETGDDILQEKYKQLIAPFPDEAYSIDDTRGFKLTSVKAQYVKERLNEVFGFYNWRIKGEYTEKEDGILFEGVLELFLGDFKKTEHNEPVYHYVPTVGFAVRRAKSQTGDLYKGAQTDALSKAASSLGIANEVFKGNVDPTKIGASISKENPAKEAKNNNKKPASFAGKKPVKAAEDF